jgi:blue copper oxidase
VDDIPLILQDRRFESDGSLLHFPSDFNAATDPALRKGGHFLANGVEAAVLEVGAQVVRLRILNASNARIYNLGFSDARTFFQIASDGGFLSAPAPLTRLLLSPAERAEILVDFGSDEGSTLRLRSFNGGMGTALVPFPLQDTWDNTDFDLLEITVGLHARTPCWRSRRGSRRSKRFPRPRPSTWGAPDPSSSRPTRSASTAYGWT